MADETPELVVKDAHAWREWLDHNHEQDTGVWLVLAKKGTTDPTSLTYDQALDEALCYGWIDGQVRRRDASTYHQRFTSRRKRSPWSQRNVGIIARLEQEGRLHPAGVAEVERAKADGRWDAAYAGPAGIQDPPDLLTALAAQPRARAMWDILTSANRYAILHRLEETKRPETRARRIEEYVAMLAEEQTVYPQKARLGD
jgi:uncharacterized protein YdeI (YjbR/CyaY-like superfamily)